LATVTRGTFENEVNSVADIQSLDSSADMPSSRPVIASAADGSLVESLRNGEEDAFNALVEQYYTSMVRIAMIYVPSQEIAEDVVQETWIAVLKGLDRFEGRSSLKTWIYTILTNRAKTRAQREGRYVPLDLSDDSDSEPAVPTERFRPIDDPNYPNHWLPDLKPQSWENVPEAHLLSSETLTLITQAINMLPPNQREVIRLRDVEGFSSMEVCNILSLSETNQRVLLHRARSRVRAALEKYLAD
jgi:RNA polymerase sigma-70 factor (ECF subfamily)